ncbi:MAG: C25 family cysteine peptidase, partial [Candidatus Delongbacteria bacterium]
MKIFLISFLMVLTALTYCDTINFDINDYTFSDDSLTISYKEKVYKYHKPFGYSFPVVWQEDFLGGQYAEEVNINSSDSILIKPDLGIEYFDDEEQVEIWGKKFPQYQIDIGARGIKRHGGFSVLEKNPFYIYNDSLFFTTSINYDLVSFKSSDTPKSDIYHKSDMVIITLQKFETLFERYKDFKTLQGFDTRIKCIEDIYAEYPGESEVIKIRNYIKDAYLQNDVKFVLLGGGYSIIPVGEALPYVSEFTGNVHTDAFYSQLDIYPDKNGNGIYFEVSDDPDYYQDVYVGRFPGNTAGELNSIIDKTINYYSAGRDYRAGFNTSAFFGGFDIDYAGDGRELCNNAKEEFPETFTKDSLYEGLSPGFGRDGILSSLESGYNFVYTQSHGDYHNIRQKDYDFKIWSDDILDLSGVSGLYLLGACKTGSYSKDSFARKAMINPSGGCVNYVGSGAAEFVYTSDNFIAYFFRQLNRNFSYGESLSQAKIVYGEMKNARRGIFLSHSYNLLGDPSNKPFLKEPLEIDISSMGTFRKGNSTVEGMFNTSFSDTVFVTLSDSDNILSRTKATGTSFTLEYDDLTADSVNVSFYSQECFLKTERYPVSDPSDIGFDISQVKPSDQNSSGVIENNESFSVSLIFNTQFNPTGIDTLSANITGVDHSDITINAGYEKFKVPAEGTTSEIKLFDMMFSASDPFANDSSAVVEFEIKRVSGTLLFKDKIRVPLSAPRLKMESFSREGNTISPVFVNPVKGTIDKVRISIYYCFKSLYHKTEDPATKSMVTLYDIPGYSIVNDPLTFAVDSVNTYRFGFSVNGGTEYFTDEFDLSVPEPSGSSELFADHSEDRIGLEWLHDHENILGFNVYMSYNSDFSEKIQLNTDILKSNEYSFFYNEKTPVYFKVGAVDSLKREFYLSSQAKVDPIPLYKGKTFKVSPFESYNPVYLDNMLISSTKNSTVAGINSDGSLINDSGILHQADTNGFSGMSFQQGYAVGDITGDGINDMVNYLYSSGDSTLVKVISLESGIIKAQRKIYGYVMENAPVLNDLDNDGSMEIFISVFNGNIGGSPEEGSYIYGLKYNGGGLDIMNNYPIYSDADSYYVHSPSIIDLNGDGSKELIVDVGKDILVYDPVNVSPITQYSLPAKIQTSLSFCDTDSDGIFEIYALTESYGSYGKLFSFEFDGSTIIERSITQGGIDLEMRSPALYDLTPPVSFADIDNDGDTEIIVLTASKLYLFDESFNSHLNFPVDLDPRITQNNMSHPSIADLDGDGILDILFTDPNSRIWCYSGQSGDLLEGFPVKVNDLNRYELGSPAVTDLDNDG